MDLTYSNLDALLFDFDGVVVSTEHIYDRATQALARELNIEIPAEFSQRMRGRSDHVFFRALVQEYTPDISFDELVTLGRQLLREAFAGAIQYTPGYQIFRREVDARGIRSALVTSTMRNMLDYVVERSDLTLDFEQIVSGSDVERQKPDPEPYSLACRLLELDPQQSLVIEDSPAGVASGRSAGCFVAALTTTSRADSLAAAHFVVDSFEELSELLA